VTGMLLAGMVGKHGSSANGLQAARNKDMRHLLTNELPAMSGRWLLQELRSL
jgi:hypothetical protein